MGEEPEQEGSGAEGSHLWLGPDRPRKPGEVCALHGVQSRLAEPARGSRAREDLGTADTQNISHNVAFCHNPACHANPGAFDKRSVR